MLNSLGILFFLILTACSAQQKQLKEEKSEIPMDKYMQKAYVNSIEIDHEHAVENEIKIIIKGQLPSPAFKLDEIDIVVEGRNIFLTPYVVSNTKSSVIQVLIPFQTSVVITLKSRGEYKVFLFGRKETLELHYLFSN
ncbi:MAG: hypothetical protein DWQ05_10485 [Calditrichaeota bacterium]|nr:MAG: hypothetical protein DWQ05_10485 [Calditrichota bacterium]